MAAAQEQKQFAVGRADEFPVGKFRIVEVEGREIGITQLATGEFRAVRNRCPHKGAPVCKGIIGGTWLPCGVGEMVYGSEGQVLVCPWHGYEYDLNTGVELYQKDPNKLLMYPAKVQEGNVIITL